MNDELTTHLVKKFPDLFKSPFYFECGDGWHSLVNSICEKITPLIADFTKEVKESNYEEAEVYVQQVKEKYGSLRFYMTYSSDDMQKIIDKYESQSQHVCELCGAEGKIIKNKGWVMTRCLSHGT